MPNLEVSEGKKVGGFDIVMLIQLIQFIIGLFKFKVAEGNPQAKAFVAALEGTEAGKLKLAVQGEKVEALDLGSLFGMITKLTRTINLISPLIPQIIAIWTTEE